MILTMINTHDLTISFFYLIGAVLVTGLFTRIVLGKSNRLINFLPNMAVSLGILGTFAGIYLGLLEFDVSRISDSVPVLLEGLKTAFSSSIAGLFTSIILRLLYEGKSVHENARNPVPQEDPLAILKAMTAGINNLEKTALDIREEMKAALETLAENIVSSSTDSLVKALEKVIADFNVLLNELVGESFRELSAAMVKLTEWQENYRTHVDETQGKITTLLTHMQDSVKILEQASGQIDAVETRLGAIERSVGKLSVSGEDIAAHVESLALQNDTLKQGISAVRQIGEDAKGVIPSISTHIGNLTRALEDSVSGTCQKLESHNDRVGQFVEQAVKDMDQAAKAHAESTQKTLESIDQGLEQELSKALNSFVGSMASLSGKFVQDYQPLTEELRKVVRLSEKIHA